MSIKKPALIGLITSVILSLSLGLSAFADSITVGPEGGTITISSKIESITCSEGSFSRSGQNYAMKCDFVTASGTQSVYYSAEWVNSGHSAASQQRDLIQKISEKTNLINSASKNSGNSNPSGTSPDNANRPATSPEDNKCTSILPAEWCDPQSGAANIANILALVINIMTAGIGILATIGIIISGIQWMTARDKEEQIVKAKSRLFNIVLGLFVWGIMWLVLSWLIPGGVSLTIGSII